MVPAGDRGQSHDLVIPDEPGRRPYIHAAGVTPGKYEVKSLWRRDERSSFDRRFKVGRRGETIYGKRDAEIKSFALSLEEQIDSVIEHSLLGVPKAEPGSVRRFVEETHDFVDQALTRKHSKRFMERLTRLATASLAIPVMLHRARSVLSGGVQAADIVRGFEDIEGIFVVAGHMYTLVTRAEMPQYLTFDSASAEGPKLRYAGPIPRRNLETTSGTIDKNSERKAKKETKK